MQPRRYRRLCSGLQENRFLVHPLLLPPISSCPSASRLAVWTRSLRNIILSCAVLILLAACASKPAGPGYYRVVAGDTLSKIADRHGRNVSDLVRWNKLSNANQIDVGQVLRVAPPGSSGSTGIASSGPGSPPPPAATSPDSRLKAPPTVNDKAPPQRIALVWPANGKVSRSFNGSTSKGISISNAAGTPVVAAAPGTVAYSGSGLRGYGNLIILQHSDGFLTIYAHNRKLMVDEGQRVRQGQKIAEMGNSDASSVQLYFEVRHQGTPTNPTRLLPPR